MGLAPTAGNSAGNVITGLRRCHPDSEVTIPQHSNVQRDLPNSITLSIPRIQNTLPPSRPTPRSLPPTVPIHLLDHAAIASCRDILQLALPDR